TVACGTHDPPPPVMTARLRFSISLTAALLLTLTLSASPTGRVQGVIRDAGGAAVSRARITLAALAPAEHRSAASDSSGAFEFPNLRPGRWSLSVEAEGFRRVHMPEVVIHIDESTRVEISLELGERSDTVEVTALAPSLEKDRPTTQTVVD